MEGVDKVKEGVYDEQPSSCGGIGGSMNQLDTTHFLAFVQHNLEQPCRYVAEAVGFELVCIQGKVMVDGQMGFPHETCHGTGYVPRPEAVALYDALMLVDDISGVVVPHSYAERHLALEKWFCAHDYEVHYVYEFARVSWKGSISIDSWQRLSLERAAEAALIEGEGWTALPVEVKP